MILGIQYMGVLFGLIMIYLSYVYYRKKEYSWKSFLVWLAVWSAFICIIIIPQTVYGVMQALKIERTADFFVASGFLLFAVIIFYLYVTIKKTNKKVEHIVRKIAYNEKLLAPKSKPPKRKVKK